MGRALVAVLLTLLALAPAGGALAQDDEWLDETEEASEEEALDEAGEDGDAAEGDEASETEPDAAADARQWYFGPYFRYVFVPAFMLELFLAEAPTVANPAFGVAATYHTTDGPMFEIGIGYTSYGFEDAFRAEGDPVVDTEWLESDLGLVHLTGSILWDTDVVEDTLFFEYGIGLDVGIVTGELVRTEAYFNARADRYAPCEGPGLPPDAPFGYCTGPAVAYDEEGEHYGVVEERVPPIAAVPMLPRLGLRYTPLPELAIKAEAAYGIAQIWLGLSAAYAPEL